MNAHRLVASAPLVFALVACGGASTSDPSASLFASRATADATKAPPGKAVKVTLPPATAATVGTPVQLTAQVTDRSGKAVSGIVLTWSSADPTVATVNATGLVTPLKAGATSVSAVAAAAGGATGVSLVTVTAATSTTARSRYVGTNLAGVAYWSTQFPFADMMKNIEGWSSRDDNGAWAGAFPAMTADGYPASLKAGQHAVAAVAWANSRYAAGRYVILWDGDGAISFPMSNVTIAESAPNRIVIDVSVTTGPLWVSIDRTNAANPVRNLRFLWPGTESTYVSNPFNPVFLKVTAPFSTIRFMDWGLTNGSTVVRWADRPQLADLTYANGVPLEVMIALANRLKADPWFCIPHQASDEYVREFAALLHARLEPTLRPHIEYSNEVWNLSFPQTKWAVAESQRLGLQTPFGMPSLFYGQRATQIFKIVQQAYGADSGRLVRVIAGQTVWTQFSENALAWQDTAANTDVLAVAPYVTAGTADDAANVDATLKLTSDQIVDQLFATMRGSMKASMLANASLAAKYRLKMKAYESGPSSATWYFPSDKIDAVTALFSAAHRNPRMRDFYVEYYSQWLASGGDTMNQYNDVGAWSKWGLWGALEYVTQDPTTSPKYLGLTDFIASHP